MMLPPLLSLPLPQPTVELAIAHGSARAPGIGPSASALTSLASAVPASRPACVSVPPAGSVSGFGLSAGSPVEALSGDSVSRKASPSRSGGRSSSYADVATFKAAIACPSPGPSRPPKAALVGVSKPYLVLLDTETTDDILNTADEFSSLAAIFSFSGFLALSSRPPRLDLQALGTHFRPWCSDLS